MLENEGQEVETESSESTESQSEASNSSSESEGGLKASSETQNKQDTTPFHEHPRFKELVEQKNQALSQTRALEQKLAQLEAKLSQPSTPANEQAKDDLIEDLKKVDPRLAARLEAFNKALPSVEQMQQRLQTFERQQFQQATLSAVNGLHDANKVSPEIKNFVNSQLDLLWMQGKLNPGNAETEYKKIYDGIKSYEDSIRRAERESYVKDKTKDAKIPASQPKGEPAKPAAKKPTWSNDPETARQQVVERTLKKLAAQRNAS